jgi:hypothetical protein
MKTTLSLVLGALTLNAATVVAGEYLDGDQLRQVFCDKTFDGENQKSGWTFKNYHNADCDRIELHYLTGDKAGTTTVRTARIYANGDHCVIKQGRERCGKWKDMGNGVYHKFGNRRGNHVITAKNLVEGKKF